MSVFRCELATAYTDPPWPPSPPSGPPRGTNFSRRKLMHPLPPAPASTRMSTSSTNMGWMLKVKNEKSKLKSECELCFPLHFYLSRFHVLLSDWQYADLAAARAVVFVAHAPVDFREQRVVFAQPDVQPRQEPPSALAHEDGPAGHDVAVVALNAEPLRVAVTAVARTALAFFVCHEKQPSVVSFQSSVRN